MAQSNDSTRRREFCVSFGKFMIQSTDNDTKNNWVDLLQRSHVRP